MILTVNQENMLNGNCGEIVARQMRLLVRLGEIYGADAMVEIGSAQISGISYKSIGDPGIEFLEDIANLGARVKVLALLNPAGMDLERWRELGFPEEFAKKQLRIIEAFRQIGAVISVTCTPYLAGYLPRFREHLAWAESSAVSFANSVIGARTNREGGPSALAAAICGVTPNYGLHRDENRHPNIVVEVNAPLESTSDFGALGYLVGKKIKNQIPYFTGIKRANTDELKTLGAAMAASGAVAMYHVEGITPEADTISIKDLEKLYVRAEELREVYKILNTGDTPDIVFLGCPHASLHEIIVVAEKIEGKQLQRPLWICTSRSVKTGADHMGLTKIIESAGGKIIADTCMVVAPIEQMGFQTTGTNSAKAANYLPGFCKQRVLFQNIDDLIKQCL